MMTSPHFTTSPHFGDVPTSPWPGKNVGTSGDVPTFSKTWRRPHIFAPATSPHFRSSLPAKDLPPSPSRRLFSWWRRSFRLPSHEKVGTSIDVPTFFDVPTCGDVPTFFLDFDVPTFWPRNLTSPPFIDVPTFLGLEQRVGPLIPCFSLRFSGRAVALENFPLPNQ